MNRSDTLHSSPFFILRSFGSLLIDNETSDVRDHLANERSTSNPRSALATKLKIWAYWLTSGTQPKLAFLSYLRLSVYMAIVSVAITVSFHLSHKPSEIELRMARPLGSIFWVLSVSTLCIGLANYISLLHCRRPSFSWVFIKTDSCAR